MPDHLPERLPGSVHDRRVLAPLRRREGDREQVATLTRRYSQRTVEVCTSEPGAGTTRALRVLVCWRVPDG
ncbi:hypothetical protein [Streptomyces sp. NPDC056361]|uniref:hypothetical protein n=1 Tax=Streptomyces sp. NPDC056361 TaxID=3345795 RepID=UPI0035DDB5CC